MWTLLTLVEGLIETTIYYYRMLAIIEYLPGRLLTLTALTLTALVAIGEPER